MRHLLKILIVNALVCLAWFDGVSQCPGRTNIWKQVMNIDTSNSLSYAQKLEALYKIKKINETCAVTDDSVTALVFLKLGKYEFLAKKDYESSINFTGIALKISRTSAKENSKLLTINSYYNLASSYQSLMLYSKAISYYDTVIFLCRRFIDTNYFVLDARYNKAVIFFSTGDYQKAVDESILGMNLAIQEKDSSYYVYFLNRKAQSLYLENHVQPALMNAEAAVLIAKRINNPFELATAYKTLALIFEKEKKFALANSFFNQSIETRKLTHDNRQIASDYNDLGNFFLNSLQDYLNAKKNYTKTLEFANKIEDSTERSLKIALANVNLGENSFRQHKLKEAEYFYLKCLEKLKINIQDIKANPTTSQLNLVINKDLVVVVMNDKTELLLQLYKNSKQETFLKACIQTALLTDSVITNLRHEHTEEQSKLYWRDKTREFFINAMEACYLANNTSLAFYFMEKSRAVLLNDKLNELGSSAYLPAAETVREESYEIKIIQLQQQLSKLSDSSKDYQKVQSQFLYAKDNLEHYVKSLEQKYPAYYQYKYADEVPSLGSLQQYLAKNNQSFVYYFMGDTVTYILAITSATTKPIRLSQKDFNRDQLVSFLQLCSDKQNLNNSYASFATLSNSIYKTLFQRLQLSKGRVIICADNFAIPFDALCEDPGGKHFLLQDYTFSYVYSARYLMKQFNNSTAAGNFLGFAPVSFAAYLDVPDLKNAATALYASSAYYNNNKLFTNQNATRGNFFHYASSYSIVSIFSHARADTTENEPILFMQDSAIHLSEVQLLKNPATRLVLLSACQTNIGKNATGEGVYSLARAFTSAGIPSVAATLWKADEQTIYAISEKFNEYLSKGMDKDEALQKAKLFFIQNNSSEKMLPYYWANMILIGNTDSIDLATQQNNHWWWMAGAAIIAVSILFLFMRRRQSSDGHKK